MEISKIIDINIVSRTFRIVLILVGWYITSKVVNKSISVFFRKLIAKSTTLSYKSRLNTAKSILRGLISLAIWMILIIMVVSDLGFNVTPLLTGAGILGIAISFGAQALIKDIISGFVLILDNQINVGDRVTIGDSEGTVIKILLRNTVLKDKRGNLIYIPNSEVKKVTIFQENNKNY